MKNKNFSRPCPVCSGKTGGVLHRLQMLVPEDNQLPNEYDIVACKRCGSCFADTIATEENYDYYYQNHNYYGNGWQYNSSSYTDKAIISRVLKVYFSLDTMIMDMGCGNGQLLDFLSGEGFKNLVGVDPSETSIRSIKSNGYQGEVGSIYNSPNDDGLKAQVVICAMVLEHLLRPDKAIINLKENYLNNEGYLLFTWPRFEDLMVDESPMMNNFNHEHINYFSVDSVDLLMNRFGFERVCNHIGHAAQRRNYTTFSNIALYHLLQGDLRTEDELAKIDNVTSNSIFEYINRVQDKELKLIESINNLAKTQDELVIWGTGAYMMHLMAVTKLSRCNIKFFVDNNVLKKNQKVFGYDVESPDTLGDFNGKILITAMLYVEDIIEQIRDRNIKNELLY